MLLASGGAEHTAIHALPLPMRIPRHLCNIAQGGIVTAK